MIASHCRPDLDFKYRVSIWERNNLQCTVPISSRLNYLWQCTWPISISSRLYYLWQCTWPLPISTRLYYLWHSLIHSLQLHRPQQTQRNNIKITISTSKNANARSSIQLNNGECASMDFSTQIHHTHRSKSYFVEENNYDYDGNNFL